ncbi:hypothetical protein L596_015209 [Steinernema carpocapsae]|uniref:Uncharacterized protein n=1 Tax=Steinernema carpocapsae TaxID=34508 RepID=A0A4U5NF77_STECR|nr:hypothetical protein L596_015209 [Steinernema carpocapsae]
MKSTLKRTPRSSRTLGFIPGLLKLARPSKSFPTKRLTYLFRLKLKYCPSVVVRKENDPIGLKMSTCLGTQNHLWVLEEHRMKGIGRAIEMKLAQECIRFVKLSNENVVKRTNRPDLDSKGGHLREAPHNRLCPP